MVGKVIRDYMEGGAKRLTVPGFGTFIRREENDGVVFVDLLRKDDGKLNELVEDCGGYSEVDAMALVDRFIFETKKTIERTGKATIEGFGTLTVDGKGLYLFDHTPRNRPEAREHAVQEKLFEEGEGVGAATTATVARSATAKVAETAKPAPEPRKSSVSAGAPRRGEARKGKGKLSNGDTILLVAIIAAVVAVIAMAFAFSAGNMPFLGGSN